jgi:Ctr copper transporter family
MGILQFLLGVFVLNLLYSGVICKSVNSDGISGNADFIGDSVLVETERRNEINQVDMLGGGSHNQTEFCQGMYMTMFMDGFHWTMLLPRGRPSSQCLNYFLANWKLGNPSQFRGAMLFSFLLALLLEGLSVARTACIRYFVTLELDRLSRTSESRWNGFLQHLCLTIIYGLHALLGYLLMFIVMSYSVELVASVIVGLIVGNRLWMPYSLEDDDNAGMIQPSVVDDVSPVRSTTLSLGIAYSGKIRKRS